MSNFRLRLDRISSATRNANLPREVIVGPQIIAKEGYILAVRVLNDKTVYNVIEDVTGRQIKVREGDIVAGVLGRRRALKGYAGDVPESIQVGDTIQILNQGGIIGKCRSQVPDLGPPFDCEVLGAIQRLPEGGDRVGVPASILEGAVPPATTLNDNIPPVVFVAGSAMNSGKTVACIQTVRFLSRAGLKVAACKLTGVSLRRDTLAMEDAGAIAAISFNDTGVATTYAGAAVTSAKGIFNHLATLSPDVIVAELGDGILGEYGVAEILEDAELAEAAQACVVCAPDQVAAWGAQRLFADRFTRVPIDVISGPVTDALVGREYIAKNLGLAAANAVLEPERLAELVLEALKLESLKHQTPRPAVTGLEELPEHED